jgi:hypothetical protein
MVLVALYLRAYRHVVQARGLIVVYLTAGAIAAGLWLVDLPPEAGHLG